MYTIVPDAIIRYLNYIAGYSSSPTSDPFNPTIQNWECGNYTWKQKRLLHKKYRRLVDANKIRYSNLTIFNPEHIYWNGQDLVDLVFCGGGLRCIIQLEFWMFYNVLHGQEINKSNYGDIRFSASYGYVFMDNVGIFDLELFDICKASLDKHEILRHFSKSDIELLLAIREMSIHDAERHIKKKQRKRLVKIYKQMPIDIVELIHDYL